MNESMELTRLKDKLPKCEMLLKEKSDSIKQLKSKVRYYEHVLKTKHLDVRSTEKCSSQKENEDEHNITVSDFTLNLEDPFENTHSFFSG